MTAPLIFLDCDGVLNTHDSNRDGICGIHRDKIERLNRIVELSGAEVVISSAWRYMILGGAMSVDGFRYMLVTHGLRSFVKVVGHTKSDEEIPERGDQITAYLAEHGPTSYVILDDGSELPTEGCARTMTESLRVVHGERWIVVDPETGLTDAHVAEALRILGCERETR